MRIPADKETERQVNGMPVQSKISMANTIWAMPPGNDSPMISCQLKTFCLLRNNKHENPMKKASNKPNVTISDFFVYGKNRTGCVAYFIGQDVIVIVADNNHVR